MSIDCDLTFEYVNDEDHAFVLALDKVRAKERRVLRHDMRLIVASVISGVRV